MRNPSPLQNLNKCKAILSDKKRLVCIAWEGDDKWIMLGYRQKKKLTKSSSFHFWESTKGIIGEKSRNIISARKSRANQQTSVTCLLLTNYKLTMRSVFWLSTSFLYWPNISQQFSVYLRRTWVYYDLFFWLLQNNSSFRIKWVVVLIKMRL